MDVESHNLPFIFSFASGNNGLLQSISTDLKQFQQQFENNYLGPMAKF